MVERDVREQHDLRIENVGGVKAAAEACFDDRDVELLLGELGQRGRGQRLELRRADCLGVRANAGDRPLE